MRKYVSGNPEHQPTTMVDRSFRPRAAPEDSRLLCISEDPRMAAREIVPQLNAAGYDVELVHAEQSLAMDFSATPYRLFLIDIGAADGTGYRACERMRFKTNLPIVLVLRGVARQDILRGYQAGADAYVLAPFDVRELVGRMKAVSRRLPAQQRPV